jgi:hypothetical protein
MPGNNPEENIQHTEHSESLKLRTFHAYFSERIIDDILISMNFRLYTRRENIYSHNFTPYFFNNLCQYALLINLNLPVFI